MKTFASLGFLFGTLIRGDWLFRKITYTVNYENA